MKRVRNLTHKTALAAACAAALLQISGCAVHDIYREQAGLDNSARTQAEAPLKARPVVAVHEGAWLLGEKIRASKPQPEIYDKYVVFTPANGSTTTLAEIADWITTNAHVPAIIDASVSTAPTGSPGVAGAAASGAAAAWRVLPSPAVGISLPALPPPDGANVAGAIPFATYRGRFKGFVQLVDTRFGVWERYRDGSLTFLKTETRTFTLPTIADGATMTGAISTGDASGSFSGASAGVGSVGAGSMGSSGSMSSGSGSTGSQNITLNVSATPWLTLQSTAQAIGGPGAVVVADKDLGILTVTGTPPQCDRIEDFVKNLNAMYGKQVAIDVRVYQVQSNEEHNYGLNLVLAYKSAGGHTGLSMTSASAPTVTGTSTPMTFGATILGGTLSGSSAAVQALSTLGKVSQVISRSGVTQNGKVLALQAARQQGYVQSTQSTLAASVGSTTTLQTGTLVPGFTSSFLPKVIDGKILIDFDMTLSDLLGLQTFTSGSGSSQSSVQLPNMQLTRFQQSISLNPGETLVLTGMRQQNTSTTNNGVGSPYMPLLGGGVDTQRGDTIIAVVISARLL